MQQEFVCSLAAYKEQVKQVTAHAHFYLPILWSVQIITMKKFAWDPR